MSQARDEIRDEIRKLIGQLADLDLEGHEGAYVAHFYVVSEVALPDGGYTRLDLCSDGTSVHTAKGLLYDAMTDPSWWKRKRRAQ